MAKNDENITQSINNLTNNLINNEQLFNSISELNGKVESGFDLLEDAIESVNNNLLDLGDQSTNTFSPINNEVGVSRQLLPNDNTTDRDAQQTIVNVSETQIDDIGNDKDDDMEFNNVDIPTETAQSISPQSIQDSSPTNVDSLSVKVDNSDILDYLANITNSSNNENSEIKSNNLQIVDTNIADVVDNIVTEVVPNINEVLTQTTNNNSEFTNALSEITNTINNFQEQQIITSDLVPSTLNVSPAGVNIASVDVKGKSQTTLEMLSELVDITPRSNNVIDITEAIPESTNPAFADINLSYAGVEEKNKILQLTAEIEKSGDDAKIAELESIKDQINNRDSSSFFTNSNFKDNTQTPSFMQEAPVIKVENKQHITAKFDEDTVDIFNKMLRQLTKLNNKFDKILEQ